jgi:hypothetical protein
MLLLVLSGLMLLHGARSAIESRAFSNDLPLDITIQVILSLILGIVGAVLSSKPLLVKYESANASRYSYEQLEHVKAFRVFSK